MLVSALTDPLISGIAKGSEQYKLVGSYVTAPLNWCAPLWKLSTVPAVLKPSNPLVGLSSLARILSTIRLRTCRAQPSVSQDLGGKIVRLTSSNVSFNLLFPPSSGSQTMAYVMGLQQGWDTTKMEFKSAVTFPTL